MILGCKIVYMVAYKELGCSALSARSGYCFPFARACLCKCFPLISDPWSLNETILIDSCSYNIIAIFCLSHDGSFAFKFDHQSTGFRHLFATLTLGLVDIRAMISPGHKLAVFPGLPDLSHVVFARWKQMPNVSTCCGWGMG